MANGGWEFGTAGGKLQGKISWSSSSNGSSANTSNITAILYARRVDGYTTTGQSWSGYVKIQGKDNSSQTNISFDHSVSIGGSWVEVARTTLNNAKHNDDGSGSATVSGSVTGPSGTGLSGITSSGSSGITLDKIARYTSITGFSVDKRDETSFTFNWQTSDTIDYAWYSTNNGSNWSGVDVGDGTSGSFAVTGLGIGTTYNCKLRVRRKDSQLTTDSGVVSKTTNTRPTSQVTGTSETTMSVKWTSDGTSNHIWYSLNNGSWVDVGNVNATTGTYTVSGLSQGTTYNVKTLVRKSNTSGQYESANASGTTYYYPHCTSTPNFVIGNSVTLQFYNPLNRSIQIQMWSHVKQDFVTDLITIGKVTQYTLTPDTNRLYSSIPNAQSSNYNIDVWYDNHKEVADRGNSYSINTSNIKPGFSNFAYKDVGTSALTAAIANNQVIVQGVSNVNLVISSANKMTPSKNASACTSSNSKYVATFDNLSKTQAYSDNDIDINMGVPTGNGSKVFTVTAYDSRNIPNSVPKTINIIPYAQPEVNPSLERLNGFETATTFSVAGRFSPVTVSSTDKNQISSIQYRYKESSSSTWGDWTAMTIESQGSGSYQTTSVTLQCDNEKQFDFQFTVTDLARTVTVSRTLSVGVPLMMLHTNGILDVQNGIKSGKSDGTGSFELNGSWGSQIYWKENGFGDKFKIIPEFNGADDDNKLRIQGAVGDAGTDPSLYDLMTISGKNGNLWVKGDISANNYKVISLTGGNGNTTGYRCFCAFNATTWNNYRAVMFVRSRHSGNGLLSVGISFGASASTLSGTPSFTIDGNLTQFGGGDAWVLRIDGSKVELWWKYYDYNDTTITVISSNINIVSGGTWQTSLPSGGTKYYACNSAYPVGAIYMSAVNTSPTYLFGGTWVQLKSRFIYATGNAEGSGSAAGKDNMSSGTGTDTISQSTTTTGGNNGNTGGVTLTAAQSGLRQHKHTISGNYAKDVSKQNIWGSPIWNNSDGSWCGQYSGVSVNDVAAANATGSHSHTLNNHTHSYSHTHGISYIAVYMWQRTA